MSLYADIVSAIASSANDLTSRWDGLSKYLVASFFEVENKGDLSAPDWQAVEDGKVVKAALSDANMEIDLNWQSPFENSGVESKAPSLFAMLQSGALQPVLDAILNRAGATTAAQDTKNELNKFEGRTGITKLNSTQVFSGMPPVKINVTAVFRAWKDGATEVEKPFDQLMQWALPKKLSADGSILARIAETSKGENEYIETLLPSLSPVKIGMTYKNRTYMPLVIENISMPLNSPINSSGHYVSMQVQMTLCSLTAIDRDDWTNIATKVI